MSRRARSQDGMTIVEVLVAATLLVSGIAFAVTALNGSRELTLKSERVDQAVAVGQREIEKLRSMPFDRLATQTIPTSTTQQPSFLGATANLLVVAEGVVGLKVDVPPSAQTFVPANTNGLPFMSCIAPASVADTTACPATGRITSGNTRGMVYRYVTWQNSCINLTVAGVCASIPLLQRQSQDAKRVTVIVALDPLRGKSSNPIETDTVVTA